MNDTSRHLGLAASALSLLRQAQAKFGRGELGAAGVLIDQALAIAPDHPELLRHKALVLFKQKRFAESADVVKCILQGCPRDASGHNLLGSALGAAGDMPGAIEALRVACKLAPTCANYWYNLAKALERVADNDGTHTALMRLLELEPEDAEARLLRSDTLRIRGDLDAAAADLRYVLSRNPDSIEAWVRLVNLKSVQLNEHDLAEINRIYSRAGATEAQRIWLGFAYALALERHGRYADAFPVFVESTSKKRRQLDWDANKASRVVDDIMTAFDRPIQQAPDPDLGREVIFVFGMPRSGSTLIEQILCAHPQVEGAGEIHDLDAVLREESDRRGADLVQWGPKATAEDWARLGNAYLQRTAHLRTSRPRLTDKGLDNWRMLGAARAMLPGARFIHCQRDPVETCWSCFKHAFQNAQLPYSYDFRELAAYWHDSDRMVRFWKTKYPGLIYDYVYEDLLDHPEIQIRRVLDYCGLVFDASCMKFHETERNVRTMSAGQVRQPLQRESTRSSSYEALLDPLREALGVPVFSQ